MDAVPPIAQPDPTPAEPPITAPTWQIVITSDPPILQDAEAARLASLIQGLLNYSSSGYVYTATASESPS
jgi:hypothetical protein